MARNKSPYLEHEGRLADIIAAIQVMGTYRYSGRTVQAWAVILGSKPKSAQSWKVIFDEHPEFFRAELDEGDFHTLVVRRAQPRISDTQTGQTITHEQFKSLVGKERRRYSRLPLSSEQILSLVDVAVKMQTQAVLLRQEFRWWIPIAVALISSLAGVFIGSLIKAH